jgi:hypothetical protein
LLQKISSVLLITALSASCVTIPDTVHFAVAGKMAKGMLGSHTIQDIDIDLNYCEMIDFLEPQQEREIVAIPGTSVQDYLDGPGSCESRLVQPTLERPLVKFGSRAGAVAMSADDMTKEKTALEQACRDLGKSCSYESKKAIASLRSPLSRMKNGKTDEIGKKGLGLSLGLGLGLEGPEIGPGSPELDRDGRDTREE